MHKLINAFQWYLWANIVYGIPCTAEIDDKHEQILSVTFSNLINPRRMRERGLQ